MLEKIVKHAQDYPILGLGFAICHTKGGTSCSNSLACSGFLFRHDGRLFYRCSGCTAVTNPIAAQAVQQSHTNNRV